MATSRAAAPAHGLALVPAFFGLVRFAHTVFALPFAFAGACYGLGTGYRGFDHSFHYAEYAIVLVILLVLAYLVYRWIAAARVAQRAEDSPR